MSGGHWYYMQTRMSDLADAMQDDLDRAGKKDEYGRAYPEGEALLASLRTAQLLLRATRELATSLDRYLSGDTGDEALAAALTEWATNSAGEAEKAFAELRALLKCS